MALAYRTVLQLPADVDVAKLVEQEAEVWLASKLKAPNRERLRRGDYFQPGVYDLGHHSRLGVSRIGDPAGGESSLLIEFDEKNKAGSWRVELAAISIRSGSVLKRVLSIEATRTDGSDSVGQVDPPKLVRQLLARESVFDGHAEVAAEPIFVRPEQVSEVYDAIVDPDRSVAVVLASSIGREYDDQLRERVRALTSRVVGVAAVYFLSEDSADLLNARLPFSHQLQVGRVRTYLNQVDLGDPIDGRRHRTLGPATFARSIRGRRVTESLQRAFAEETRSILLEAPLAKDVRRGKLALERALRDSSREAAIELKVQRSIAIPAGGGDAARRENVLDLVKALLRRWLRTPVDVSEESISELDEFILRETATAQTILEEASKLEDLVGIKDQQLEDRKRDNDALELELASIQEEEFGLRRRVEYLQRALIEAGRFAEAHVPLAADDDWIVPASLEELATCISAHASSDARHPAFEVVEFTGDMRLVAEASKRDSLGRYTSSVWEFVQVLYDFSHLKLAGEFSGGLHSYLTDDSVTTRKCPPGRHAANESDTVINTQKWRAERVFPVPQKVDSDGSVFMGAHYKPTHSDTFAPRVHYYDDLAQTGKIYIGYIGRHLTTKGTRNA